MKLKRTSIGGLACFGAGAFAADVAALATMHGELTTFNLVVLFFAFGAGGFGALKAYMMQSHEDAPTVKGIKVVGKQ